MTSAIIKYRDELILALDYVYETTNVYTYHANKCRVFKGI